MKALPNSDQDKRRLRRFTQRFPAQAEAIRIEPGLAVDLLEIRRRPSCKILIDEEADTVDGYGTCRDRLLPIASYRGDYPIGNKVTRLARSTAAAHRLNTAGRANRSICP